MKIVGVIPARYASTRLPGKPLVDICGKPMVWWVYQQAKKVIEMDEVYVATDSAEIEKVCNEYGMSVIMTSDNLPDHISRIYEVSENVISDYYICINGDEPLIDVSDIKKVLPVSIDNKIYFGGAMVELADATKVIDNGNIKLAINNLNQCIYMSRIPIPYPQSTTNFKYKKYVGIECFNKLALNFFVNTKKGELEKIEDIDHLRFLENGLKISFTEVKGESLSVDNLKDLECVRQIMQQRIDNNEN